MPDPRQDFKSSMNRNLTSEIIDYGETGFMDNAGASLMNFIDEDLTISEYINNGSRRDRDDQLKEMYNTGVFSDDEWNSFRSNHGKSVTTDWDAAVNLAKFKGLEGSDSLKTNQELDDNLRDELKFRRDYANKIHENATIMGDVGSFGGMVLGASLDPVNVLATVAVPVKAYQGMSILQRVGTASAVNMGAETIIQPVVYNYKQQVDSPYSGKDAMLSIAAAGVFGGTIEGMTQLMMAGIKRGKMHRGKVEDPDQLDGAIDSVQQQVDELNQAPDKQMSAADHVQKIDNEVRATSAHNKPIADNNDPYISVEDADLDSAYTRVSQVLSEDSAQIDAAVAKETARLSGTADRKLTRIDKKKAKRELGDIQSEAVNTRSQIDELMSESKVRRAEMAAKRGAPKTKSEELRNQVDYEKIPVEYDLRLKKLQTRLTELEQGEIDLLQRIKPEADLKEFNALTRAAKVDQLFPDGPPQIVEEVIEVIQPPKKETGDASTVAQEIDEVAGLQQVDGDYMKAITRLPDIKLVTATSEMKGTLVHSMDTAKALLEREGEFRKKLEASKTCLL